MIIIAMDRSARRRDKDQRLHVETSNIAKACVSPYYGREIPGWDKLGLDPRKTYRMLRDPEELAKAAPTFDRLPILYVHKYVSARHPKMEIVVGTTGSDCTFDGTYLKNSLGFWTDIAIDVIETKSKCELSPAYHYKPDMTPGIFNGLTYDGVMRNIEGNHVALVEEGRQGPDVVVGDESMKNKVAAVKLGLLGHVKPMLAQDAKLDITAAFDGVTSENVEANKAKIVAAVMSAAEPELAADTALDAAVLSSIIDDSLALAQDEADEPAPKPKPRAKAVATPSPSEVDSPVALDEAAVARMIREAEARGAERAASLQAAIRTAEKDIAPLVGEIVAQDSAEAYYRIALDGAGYSADDLKDTPLATLKAMVAREVGRKEVRAPIAQDAVQKDRHKDFSTRFPNAVKLVRS